MRFGIEVFEFEFDAVWWISPAGSFRFYYDYRQNRFFLGDAGDTGLSDLRLPGPESGHISIRERILSINGVPALTLFPDGHGFRARSATPEGRITIDASNRRFTVRRFKETLSYVSAGEFGSTPGLELTDILSDGQYLRIYQETEEYNFNQENVRAAWGVVGVYCPIRNKSGEKTGLLIAGMQHQALIRLEQTGYLLAVLSFIASLGVVLALQPILRREILNPLQILRKIVRQSGKLDDRDSLILDRRDEIGELGRIYREKNEKILRSLSAARRFVPEPFLRILRHPDITGLRHGQSNTVKLSVLFSDIRDFIRISEQMSPAECFRFLNQYLKIMGPAIPSQNGFIDKFMGDGIMALFEEPVDNAIAAAIAMQRALHTFNRNGIKSGREPVRTGIGIHFGIQRLGIIGDDSRYDATVISDSVNLASRLEGLTKQYGVTILVSAEVIESIVNPIPWRFRLLDQVRVKGREAPVKIYQIFDGITQMDIASERHEYTETITMYLSGKQDTVPERITDWLSRHENNLAARMLRNRIASEAGRNRENTQPDVFRFEEK